MPKAPASRVTLPVVPTAERLEDGPAGSSAPEPPKPNTAGSAVLKLVLAAAELVKRANLAAGEEDPPDAPEVPTAAQRIALGFL